MQSSPNPIVEVCLKTMEGAEIRCPVCDHAFKWCMDEGVFTYVDGCGHFYGLSRGQTCMSIFFKRGDNGRIRARS